MKIRIDKENKPQVKFIVRKFDGHSVIGEMWGNLGVFPTEQEAIDFCASKYPQLPVKINY